MPDPQVAQQPKQSKKGVSLWSDAWRRLKKNKFAMAGLFIVVFVSLVTIFADLLLSYEDDYGQPWVRAQPPGYEHPAVLAEIRYDLGDEAAVPERVPDLVAEIMTTDGVLEYDVQEIDRIKYRIKLRRGKIDQIKRVEGALTVKRVEVKGEGEYLTYVDGGGEQFKNVVLERRKPLPDGIRAEGKVLLLEHTRPRVAQTETVRVTIKDGKIVAIERAGQPLDKLRIEGRFIHEVRKDGKPQVLVHVLGTDLAGRDMLARVVYGGQISLMVGAVATLVSVLIGVLYGAIAGYTAQSPLSAGHVTGLVIGPVGSLGLFYTAGFSWVTVIVALALLFFAPKLLGALGRRDSVRFLSRTITTTGEFMMRIVDILNALPFMFLVILLMVAFDRNLLTLFAALGAVQWLMIARIVRGQVLSLKEKEFIEASHMCGSGHMAILLRHLIPNTLGVVIVYSTLTIPAVILQESFLAFIGLNVEWGGRTRDSWGSLVNIGRQALTSDGGNWWVLVWPSLVMAVTLFSLNFLGDGVRDALDPKLKGKS